MASNEASGNNSEDQCPTVAPSGSSIYDVPDDLLQTVFQHLSVTDLCHVASCSRWLRDVTNQDSLWRPRCQSRGWEHYGTTTDLAKIASYGSSEQVTGATEAWHSSITFKEDMIVDDDDTTGLTSTCRWKGVYMRAYHLDRNWAKNRRDSKFIYLLKPPRYSHYEASVDGDILVIAEPHNLLVFDIRKGNFEYLINVFNLSCNHIEKMKINDGVIVVVFRDYVVRAFDVKTRQMLTSMQGCRHEANLLPLLFDDELVFTCNKSDGNNDINVWDIQDGTVLILTDASLNRDPVCDWDYRNRTLVAVNTTNILVWDGRSKTCLHRLPCGKRPRVKLRNNVIVCLSQNDDTGMWHLNIWRKDTGECQQVIPLSEIDRPYPLFINSLIVVEDGIRRYDGDDPDAGRKERVKVIYDLNGKLVKEKMDRKLCRSMLSVCDYAGRSHGSKCPFVTIDPKDRRRKPFIFDVTPNGLVQLFAARQKASNLSFIWMDEIRMILLDRDKYMLLIFHYW